MYKLFNKTKNIQTYYVSCYLSTIKQHLYKYVVTACRQRDLHDSGRNVHDAAIESNVGPTQRGETSTSYDAGVKYDR